MKAMVTPNKMAKICSHWILWFFVSLFLCFFVSLFLCFFHRRAPTITNLTIQIHHLSSSPSPWSTPSLTATLWSSVTAIIFTTSSHYTSPSPSHVHHHPPLSRSQLHHTVYHHHLHIFITIRYHHHHTSSSSPSITCHHHLYNFVTPYITITFTYLPIKAALAGWKKVVNGSLFFHCIFFCVHLMMSGWLPACFCHSICLSASLFWSSFVFECVRVCVCACVYVTLSRNWPKFSDPQSQYVRMLMYVNENKMQSFMTLSNQKPSAAGLFRSKIWRTHFSLSFLANCSHEILQSSKQVPRDHNAIVGRGIQPPSAPYAPLQPTHIPKDHLKSSFFNFTTLALWTNWSTLWTDGPTVKLTDRPIDGQSLS